MTTLNPLTLPLASTQLIEASAGSGKTFTLGVLFLRLLLERRLEVDRILVVTFTKAATEELRERIRRRVADALTWMDAKGGHRDADPTLGALIEGLTDPSEAHQRLADALTRMDEAAIFTIHGFCQRMLQENAFESGTPFEAEFITDETDLRHAAAADFWRRRVVPLDATEARRVQAIATSPAALLGELGPSLSQQDLRLLPEVDRATLDAHRRAMQGLFERILRLWGSEEARVRAILEKDPALDRKSYNKGVVSRAIQALEEYLATGDPEAEPARPFERLTPAMLAEKSKPGSVTPSHPLFDACAELAAAQAALPGLRRAALLGEARSFIRAALDQAKAERRQLYFDDLLHRLAAALAAPGGERLASAIRTRFPAALIDEFQDTDPLQYRIFSQIYSETRAAPIPPPPPGEGWGEGTNPALFLCLVGDPKQAIYAFRGADIFTYIQARRAVTPECRHGLTTNWRSTSTLVAGVNALFGRARAPFIFEPDIRFDPASPSPTADEAPLTLDGAPPIPLQFALLRGEGDGVRGKGGSILAEPARQEAATYCAEVVADLLIRAGEGCVRLGERPLQAGDIALLVRSHTEGDLVQRALRRCGVASVTLSQASVFESTEAAELGTLLAALAEPGNEGLVRAALATELLGRRQSDLFALLDDEAAWEGVIERLREWRALWLERGFVATFQRLLQDEAVAPRLLALPDGERRLTNLLQLGELLAEAAAGLPGLDGLLRWFSTRRIDPGPDEAAQLRLESDEQLVKIVTMHKSKGLEYPVVLLPFPWSYFQPPPGRAPAPLFHDPVSGRPCLDLGSPDVDLHHATAETEALAERLRLFYVAVTRARKLCLLCWGRVNQAEGSAPAYLLHQEPQAEPPASRMKGLDDAAIRADLEALAQAATGAIAVYDAPPPRGLRYRPSQADPATLRARGFQGVIDRGWRVSSYSGLITGAGGDEAERPGRDPAGEAIPPGERQVLLGSIPADPVVTGYGEGGQASAEYNSALPDDPALTLPGGTRTGDLLHAILEGLDFAAEDAVILGLIDAALARFGIPPETPIAREGPAWRDAVALIIRRTLETPLAAAGPTLRLRDLPAEDRIAELEFHFPLRRPLDPARLADALAGFADYAPAGRDLRFDPRRGLMHGFIDLIFRHQGRYYVADYKSNRLGPTLEDYAAPRLGHAMQDHRYPLQYLIYVLALHRFLERKMAGYDYERDFGGVYYLFLRGLRPERGPSHGVFFDRPTRAVIAALEGLTQ